MRFNLNFRKLKRSSRNKKKKNTWKNKITTLMDTIIQDHKLPKIRIRKVDRIKSLGSFKDDTLSIPLTEVRTRLATDASYGSRSQRNNAFFNLTTANTTAYTDRDSSFRNGQEEGRKFKKLLIKS